MMVSVPVRFVVARQATVIHGTAPYLRPRKGRVRCLCHTLIDLAPRAPNRVTGRFEFCSACVAGCAALQDPFAVAVCGPYPEWLLRGIQILDWEGLSEQDAVLAGVT